MKKFCIVLCVFVLLLVGCGKEREEELLNIDYSGKGHEVSLKYDTTNPVVALYIEKYGSVVMELYPDIAPNTVNNFISLVKSGFYDNNTFHRLVPGFVLQGGDPTGTGTGGADYNIKGEFKSNGFNNDLKHEKWIVSMARSQSNDSASSQFFIMLGDSSYLDGEYAAFGKVIDGKQIIKDIEKNEVVVNSETGQLSDNLIIKKCVIDLHGKEYGEVEKITSK